MSAALRRMRLLSASAVVSSAHPCRRLACFLIRVDGWMDGWLQLRIVGSRLPYRPQNLSMLKRNNRQTGQQQVSHLNHATERERERERMQAASSQSQTTDRSRCFPSVCVSGGGGSAVLGVTRLLHSLFVAKQTRKHAPVLCRSHPRRREVTQPTIDIDLGAESLMRPD